MKISSNVPGHMTKMASRPIYGKNLPKSSKRPMTLKLDIQHLILKYNQICSNNDTGLILTSFMTWSNLFRNASAWVKAYTAYSHVFPRLFSSRKLLRIKVTPDLQLTYSKNGGNLGLVLKMKNIACLSISLTKHIKILIYICLNLFYTVL